MKAKAITFDLKSIVVAVVTTGLLLSASLVPLERTHAKSLDDMTLDELINLISALQKEAETASNVNSSNNKGVFEKGSQVKTIDTLRVRSEAGLGGFFSGSQPLGRVGVVTDGPKVASGYTWWKIDYESGPDGWSASDWLWTGARDKDTDGTKTATSDHSFEVGDTVRTTRNTPLYTNPDGVSNQFNATQAAGVEGEIIDGPEESIRGASLIKVDFENEVDGWVDVDDIKLVDDSDEVEKNTCYSAGINREHGYRSWVVINQDRTVDFVAGGIYICNDGVWEEGTRDSAVNKSTSVNASSFCGRNGCDDGDSDRDGVVKGATTTSIGAIAQELFKRLKKELLSR